MISLSPGLLIGAFDLLRLVELTPLTLHEIPGAFSKLGGMPVKDVLTVVQELNWIEVTPSGSVELTLSGARIRSLTDHRARTCSAILDYIDIVRPVWLQAAASGRSRVLLFAGTAITQVFDEAGLAEGTDPSTVAFWDALAARARGLKNDRLTAVGRIGERASVEYERQRTGLEPKWVSLESNTDGYDVLSVVDGIDDKRPLSIEVKATTFAEGGHFYLTKHEWRRAKEMDHHVFHLWRVKDDSPMHPPIVVTAAAMAAHVPRNNGAGEWESVTIPFSVFSN